MVFERVPIIRLNRCELMQFNSNYCMPRRDNSPPLKSRKTILNKSAIQPQPLIFDHEVMSRTNYQHNQNNHDQGPQTLNTTSQLTPKTNKKQNQQSKPPVLKFTHALLTYQNVSEPNISETLAFDHKDIIKQTRSDSISRQHDNALNLQDSMFANNISSRSPNNELATLNFGEENIKQTTKSTKKTNVLNQQNTMFVNDITLSQQLDHHQQKRKTLNDIDEEKTKQIKQLSNIQLNLHSYKNIGHSLKEISRPQSVGENESCNNYFNTLPIGIKGSQQRQRNLSGEVNSIGLIHGQKEIETLNDPQQSKQENLDLVKTIAKHKASRIVISQPDFNRLEDIEENKGLAKDRICYQNTSMADKIEPEKEIRLVSVSCDLLNKMNTVKSFNGIDDLVAPLDNDADDEGSLRNNSSSLVVDHGYNTSSSKENLSDIDEPETLFVESDRRSKNGNLSDFADTDDSCIKENLNERRLSDEDNLGERELVNFEIEGQYHHKYLLLIDNSGDLNNDHLTEIEEEVDSSDEEEQDCSYHSYYYSTDRRSSSPAVLTKSRHTRRNYLSEIKEVTSDEESEFCCPKDTLSYHRRSSLPAILDSGSTDDSNKDTFNKTKSSCTICSNREIFRNIKEETPNSVNLVSPSNRRRRTSPLATPRRSSMPSNLSPCEYSESMDRRQIRNDIQQTSNDIARLCDKSDSEDETNYIKKELSLKPKKSEYEPSHTRRKISRVNSLSFSPFNLRNKNTTLEKPRATLTSDLTISGRNPMLETNNYANIESVKLRSWSVDSFVKNDFKFRIERRKVISFEGLQPKTSKETISSPCEESKESNMRKNVSPLPRESDFDQHCTVNLLNQTMNSNDNVKSISSDVVERQDDVKTCNIREESIKCRKSPELDINLNIDVQKDIQPKHRQNHTDLAQRFLHLTETSPEGSELRTQNKTRRMSSDTATHQRRQMENQFQPSSVLAERLLESYRALGKHSHMYLGIASAKKCRAKRRRHSMDHIGSYRRRFRMIEELNDQGTQGDTESITTNSDNESNNGYGESAYYFD